MRRIVSTVTWLALTTVALGAQNPAIAPTPTQTTFDAQTAKTDAAIAALQQQIATLQAEIATLKSQVDSGIVMLGDVQSRLAAVESAVKQIATLQAAIDDLTARIVKLEGGGTPCTPVNCVQSAWTMESAGAWSTCSGGTQTRTETWVRTTTTEASCGGTACGPLTETRTGTQACTTPSTSTIRLMPGTVHQTMHGWEVHYQSNLYHAGFATWSPKVFDEVVAMGVNRVRMEVRSGSEHTTDNFAVWKASGMIETDAQGNRTPAYNTWRAKRYETINDNSSATSFNLSGFHWTEVDDQVEKVINPLRQRLAARGEALYVNLTYVAFTSQITSGHPYIHTNTAEYAEFMLALFQHLQTKYGWVPDGIEVILEPDNVSHWMNNGQGTLIGQAIVAAGNRLSAAGFKPEFIAPSATCTNNGVALTDQMLAVANVKTYLKELAYHRYCGADLSFVEAFATRGLQHNLRTSMLEWWSDSGLTIQTLHEDLKSGRNSAWEQSTITSLDHPTGIGAVYVNTSTNAVALTNPSKYFTRYYAHVRRGARRIEATSSAATLDPLAFINADGRHTVVVKANSGFAFTVGDLPAATYGICYTTAATMACHADQTIASGQAVSTSIPAEGVITIFAKPSGGGGGDPEPDPDPDPSSVTLRWQPGTQSGPHVTPTAGYIVLAGPESWRYPERIDVGNVTTYTYRGLSRFFRLGAVDAAGTENYSTQEIAR